LIIHTHTHTHTHTHSLRERLARAFLALRGRTVSPRVLGDLLVPGLTCVLSARPDGSVLPPLLQEPLAEMLQSLAASVPAHGADGDKDKDKDKDKDGADGGGGSKRARLLRKIRNKREKDKAKKEEKEREKERERERERERDRDGDVPDVVTMENLENDETPGSPVPEKRSRKKTLVGMLRKKKAGGSSSSKDSPGGQAED
jgi:hypothetical protein